MGRVRENHDGDDSLTGGSNNAYSEAHRATRWVSDNRDGNGGLAGAAKIARPAIDRPAGLLDDGQDQR